MNAKLRGNMARGLSDKALPVVQPFWTRAFLIPDHSPDRGFWRSRSVLGISDSSGHFRRGLARFDKIFGEIAGSLSEIPACGVYSIVSEGFGIPSPAARTRSNEGTVTAEPETRESLLMRVKDAGNREAWEQFSQIYRPVVYRMARARGMQDADAQDLAQKVLWSVAQSLPDWECRTDQGIKFRHWLRRVAKNAALNALSRSPRDQAGGGTTAIELLQRLEASPAAEREVDLEFRRQVFRRAAVLVQQRTSETNWRAFCLTMLEGVSVEEAASRLGISVGTVYAARSRVMRRVREEVAAIEGAD